MELLYIKAVAATTIILACLIGVIALETQKVRGSGSFFLLCFAAVVAVYLFNYLH